MSSRRKQRYTLELTDDFAEIVDAIAKEEHATRAEVFRRAVGLMKALRERAARGDTIVIKKKDGAEQQLVTS